MFDYLVIGHIARDVTPAGYVTGGTVAYAGATARALKCHTAVLTSAGPDFDAQAALPGIAVKSVPAAETTTFRNLYQGGERQQHLVKRAATLQPRHLPEAWKRVSVVHLGPIADEVSPELIDCFSAGLIGLTPQGWLRAWDESGHVTSRPWAQVEQVLPRAAAVVLSEQDLPGERHLATLVRHARLLVMTHGAGGCTVYMGSEQRHFPAPSVDEVNATGAGDVFAAAFFIRLYQTKGNAWEAARFANRVAALSVTQPDLEAKIRHLKVEGFSAGE